MPNLSNAQFGTGVLYGLPNAGNTAANPSPQKFGILQEAQVDVKGDLKKLYGQKQFAVAKARGKIDVMVKAKFATQDANMLNQLYWGQTSSTGMNILVADEPWTVGATSPPATTITVTNAVNATEDYGVIDYLTGMQFTRVSGTPAAGQYSIASPFTGVYTFSAADEAALRQVLISYVWFNSTRGTTVTLANQYMGYAPEFRAFLFNTFRNKIVGIELYSCTLSSYSIPTKQEDFWISDIDFDASTDSTDTLGKMYADPTQA